MSQCVLLPVFILETKIFNEGYVNLREDPQRKNVYVIMRLNINRKLIPSGGVSEGYHQCSELSKEEVVKQDNYTALRGV